MIEPRKIWGGLGNRLFQGAYLLAQQAKGEIPDIYLQDVKYFENIKDQIIEIYSQGIEKSDYVSLHIRRGDYNFNSFYTNLCETSYYDEAIKLFPNEKFIIFCADRQNEETDVNDRLWCIEWAKSKGIDFTMRYHSNEVEDLNVMAGCKSNILANSSFSFWAGFLNPNPQKIVVAPSKERWYADKIERTVCPEEWVRL